MQERRGKKGLAALLGAAVLIGAGAVFLATEHIPAPQRAISKELPADPFLKQ